MAFTCTRVTLRKDHASVQVRYAIDVETGKSGNFFGEFSTPSLNKIVYT